MDRAKRYHITVIDRLTNSVEIDDDCSSIVGVFQKADDGKDYVYSNLNATDKELTHLICSLVQLASHLSEKFVGRVEK